MPMRVLLFDADGNDSELSPSRESLQKPGQRQLLWVDVEGEAPGDLAERLADMGLENNTVRHLTQPSLARPGMMHHGTYLSLSVNAACGAEEFMPLAVVAGENFVITAHPGDIQALSEFMEQMQGDTQLGQLDSAAFLAVLLSRVLETYFAAASQVEAATDVLDETLIGALPSDDPIKQLVELRRQVGALRRELSAHRPVFMHLASPDFVLYAGDEHENQLGNLLMLYEHALDNVAHTRDLVLGSFDLYMTGLGRRTNEVMQLLTIVTIVLGILATVAGFMGMNFEADLFKTGNKGFHEVLFASGLLVLLVLGISRWRRWL